VYIPCKLWDIQRRGTWDLHSLKQGVDSLL
jgi:hypothetical protein